MKLAGLFFAMAVFLAPLNAAMLSVGEGKAVGVDDACETSAAVSCPIGGPCGGKSTDNLTGAAFGMAMIAGSVYWKRRAK
jgi:hypothetical protein